MLGTYPPIPRPEQVDALFPSLPLLSLPPPRDFAAPMGSLGDDAQLSVLWILPLATFLFLMLLLLLLFFCLSRRRQRLLGSSDTSNSATSPSTQVDVEEPLLSNDSDEVPSLFSRSVRRYPSQEHRQEDDVIVNSSLINQPPKNRENILVGPHIPDGLAVGQTLRCEEIANWRKEDIAYKGRKVISSDALEQRVSSCVDTPDNEQSTLMLEVISGPSSGIRCIRLSENCSAPLTLGRVSSSDLLLEDSGVSGKHAIVNWNKNISKWELVDTGSLNGTIINSTVVHNPGPERRCFSDPVELKNGDIITLGSSKVFVQIMPYVKYPSPVRVGIASDPMSLRRGGKHLPMEDALYSQWPLPGIDKFGLFCIFDGHGGAAAAITACKILPRIVSHAISSSKARESIISSCDASQVLKDAFSQTEAAMTHQYEGCTATVLLLWADDGNELFLQCANVGDSACFIYLDGVEIELTQDHRISAANERDRFKERGMPLAAGQTRLHGINIGRMLGDKFIKEQDPRFSSEPYVSQAVHLNSASKAFALLASDGLWDVISIRRTVQLIIQTKAAACTGQANSADIVAQAILNEARSLRTKDNTSVIFLDFDTL
ncbi:kinase associated protein phosphatase [Wolffia australiana]